VPAGAPAKQKAARKGLLSGLFRAKTATPPSVRLPGAPASPPPLPKRRGALPAKKLLLTIGCIVAVILLIAVLAVVVLPMLKPDGATSSTGSTTLKPSTSFVAIETTAPVIPATGVWVHVDYLGGWKGTYGQTGAIVTIPGNSGNRIMEVENANGTVQATFEKLDGSSHDLLVEIYKNGTALTRGITSVGHGSVALSVDTITGEAATPITSGNATTVKTTAAP
jgi:hypothetical protein